MSGVRPPPKRTPSSDGCAPPQPTLFGPRGCRYPATSSSLWRRSAFLPSRPFSAHAKISSSGAVAAPLRNLSSSSLLPKLSKLGSDQHPCIRKVVTRRSPMLRPRLAAVSDSSSAVEGPAQRAGVAGDHLPPIATLSPDVHDVEVAAPGPDHRGSPFASGEN
jgi:hypothetical protein